MGGGAPLNAGHEPVHPEPSGQPHTDLCTWPWAPGSTG